MTFYKVRKNPTTKRLEAVGCKEKSMTEMIRPIDIEEQSKQIEFDVESLLHFQEGNQTEITSDPEMGAALTESINFVSSKGVSYFDETKIDSYFYKTKERKKPSKDNPPELGGFIDKPIIRQKSTRAKEKEAEVFFYQDQSGANVYLHFLCQEFIEQYVGIEEAPDYIKVKPK